MFLHVLKKKTPHSTHLDLHVEMSLLTFLPLLGFYPFLLLQTLHQLLRDVHVCHGLKDLTYSTTHKTLKSGIAAK